MKIASLLPAFRLTINEIEKILMDFPEEFEPPLIIMNDDDEIIRDYLQNLSRKNSIRFLHIPFQIGKAEALRQGLIKLMDLSDADIFIQFDGRSKQSVKQLRLLALEINNSDNAMVIGDRYKMQNLVDQGHRKSAVGLMAAIVKYLTGYELLDTVCGTRAYSRELATLFTHLRCFGYGAEIEQIIISSLHGFQVKSFALESNQQANATNAEKIEDSLMVFINYADELNVPNEARAIFCYMLAQVKRRAGFIIDLSLFNSDLKVGFEHVNHVDGKSINIVNAYGDQVTRDAYTLHRC